MDGDFLSNDSSAGRQRAADCSALVRAAADLNEYLVFASLGRSTIQNMRLVRELDLLEASLSGAPQDQV
jgi:hypothetical protein